MTEPVHAADMRPPDGIRDRFRWDRFSTPRVLTFGMLLCLVVIIITANDPAAPVAELGERAAGEVFVRAANICEAIAGN